MAGASAGSGPSTLLRDERLSRIPLLNQLLMRITPLKSLVRIIRQAGLKRRVGEVLLYMMLLSCIVLLVNMLVGGSFIVGLLLAFIAALVPLMIVQRMRRKRALLFAEQLPDALDLTRSALQAGHGVVTALAVVGETFPDPVAEELRHVVDEMRLGLTMREALYNLSDRVDDPDLMILVVGVLVAQESGGNLAEVLENVTYTIRERFKLLRELRVMTAQGRFSGSVLTALPFLLGTFMYIWNPTYFAPLIENTAGWWMIAYALVSLLTGHMIMRRIVNVEV
jgi:tight adherence protein B